MMRVNQIVGSPVDKVNSPASIRRMNLPGSDDMSKIFELPINVVNTKKPKMLKGFNQKGKR
jgi:hypothetical protein